MRNAGKWSELQARRYNANSQPYYVLLNPVTERVLATPQGSDYEPANFQAFLGSGLQAFRAGMPQWPAARPRARPVP